MSKWLARFDARNLYTSGVPKVPLVPQPIRSVECGTEKAAPDAQSDDLDEREAMALEGGVPAAFARSFAALQISRPTTVSAARWERAINDAGLFLDAWGGQAERLGWSADDLFSPAGLAWSLEGAHVTRLTRTSATLSDERTFTRSDQGHS